jgi:integrase
MTMAKRNSKSKRDRVWERKNSDGSTSYLAVVRIRPFKPASKAFPTRVEAKRWADDLARELTTQRERGEARKDLTTLTIKGLVEEFLADPETKQLKYYDDLERLLAWWVNHCGGEKVLQFGTIKLREARELLSNGREPGTVNRYLSALRSCWNWGRAAQYIPPEKVWPTRLFRTEPRERVRFLNDAELSAVLAAAEKYAPWMYAAVIVSLATGLRQGELLRLAWKDIDFEKKTLTVLIAKNTKRRLVHLPDPAIAALKILRRDGVVGPKLVFVRPDGEPADKSYLTFHWLRVRTEAGLVDFKWHDLRHSCASFLAQNGASLVEIGSVLGHSSPSITAKYAHLVVGKPVTGSAAVAAKLSAALSAKP